MSRVEDGERDGACEGIHVTTGISMAPRDTHTVMVQVGEVSDDMSIGGPT